MKKCFSRISALILVIAMLASQLVMPIAALENDIICACDPETREGTLDRHYAPTCGYYGSDVYVCNECGGEYTILTDLPTGDHEYVNHKAQKVTCTEIGWDAYRTCKNCPYTEYVEIPALGHNWKEATCTGVKTCLTCKATEGKPLGHTAAEPAIENLIEAYCGNEGSYNLVTRCSVCNYKIKSEKVIIPAPDVHDFVNTGIVVEPGCKDDGYTVYECSKCGDEMHDPIPADGKHDYDKVVTDVTCTEAGYTTYTCKDCGYVLIEEGEEALGHDWKAATCTDPKTCARCGLIDEEFPALGHTQLEHTYVAPTCTEEGYHLYECTREGCDYVIRRAGEPIDPMAHTEFISKPAVEATCTTDGLTHEISCAHCGIVLKAQVKVNKLGHDWKAATCTEPKTCETCGATTGKPNGHGANGLFETLGIYEPKCEDDGYTAKKCLVCNEFFKDDIKPALGHAFDNACDAECNNNCGLIREVGEHDYQSVVIEPTCVKDGYTRFTCSICGDFYDVDVTDALGHIEVIDEAVEPTYDEVGYTEGSHCERCGEPIVKQNVLPRISEKVEISYEITGINGAKEVVNSGYATMNIYMTTEYARLYALTFELEIDEALEMVSIQNGSSFTVMDYNMLDAATIKMMFNEGMNYAGNTYESGKYLIATLVFRVDSEFTGNAKINVNSVDYARDTEVLLNNVVLTSAESVDVKVSMLGNSNPKKDSVIDAKDVLACAKWMTNADENEYNAIYDMNKDGVIDGEDFSLLRGAAVGDTEYLR